jgi:hypothetical protein
MTTGSNASRAPRTSSPCGAGGRCQTANMAMSSTIAMSSIPCAASRWRCSIWSIAPRSFPAAPTPLRSTPCSPDSARPARPNSPWRYKQLSTLKALIERFRPKGMTLPIVVVTLPSLAIYDQIAATVGESRMNATVKIDAARVELLLSELRLPGIKLIWAALAETADKEGWPAARFLAALPNRRWWSEAGAASNVIWKKPACRQERPSMRSTSMPCRWSQRRRCRRSPPATPGSKRTPVFWSVRRRQIASGGGTRHGSDRKGVACVVHQNHRSCAKTPDRAP